MDQIILGTIKNSNCQFHGDAIPFTVSGGAKGKIEAMEKGG